MGRFDSPKRPHNQPPLAWVDQPLMRELNERVVEREERWEELDVEPTLTLEIRCECMRADCNRTFAITAAGFRLIRGQPGLYILSAEHIPTLVEELVGRNDDYIIVRNEGLASPPPNWD
jgi:hypothetical protein